MKFLLWIFSTLTLLMQPLFSTEPQCCSSTCSYDYFEGFDLSLGVGYSSITLITSRGGIKPPSHTNYGGDGVAAQLKLGKHCTFCNVGLIGLEAYGQYNNAQTENRFFETVASTSETSRTFQMEWNLGFDLRLGLSPCPTNLIFLYAGPDWGYHDFHYVTTGVDSTFQGFRTGGGLGAGIEQIFAGCLTIRATFDYRWYLSKTLSYSNGETQTIKPRLGTTLFMVGYSF